MKFKYATAFGTKFSISRNDLRQRNIIDLVNFGPKSHEGACEVMGPSQLNFQTADMYVLNYGYDRDIFRSHKLDIDYFPIEFEIKNLMLKKIINEASENIEFNDLFP